MEGWTCICKMLNFCNVSNQNAISKFRLQYRRIAVWLLRLQSYCWDGCLIAEIAVWFWKWVKIGGPEIEASHWLRAQNWGLWLLERTGFKKIQSIGLLFRNLSPSTHFRRQSPQSDCNLHNQTSILLIRQQYLQSDCNLHNQTNISTIRLQSLQSDSNLHNQTVNWNWAQAKLSLISF